MKNGLSLLGKNYVIRPDTRHHRVLVFLGNYMKLLYNANIHTLDEKHPLASAILIAGSQVIAVGEKDKLESLAHGKVEKQDMKGKLIIPGG